jgi:2,4-dienoyl-CoA reductase (NADPH2)
MSFYPHLFDPFTRGRLKLSNRIVVTPHGTSMVRDGAITDDDIAYYETRARSHPAMIIGGAIIVHPTSALRLRSLVEGYDTRVLEGLQRRSDAIHAHGVKLVGQIVHLGRELIGGESSHVAAAPSAIRSARDPYPPHVLDETEIATLVRAFGETAVNLQNSGHDGVEIHAAHGYLVAQFLSPATNQRVDAYGGSEVKRMRFLREVIDGIRDRCRSDFVLGIRLSADEEIADGLGIPDTARIGAELARLGSVDYLSITLGTRGYYVKDVTQPEATAARAARIVREACGLPILVGQKITTPELAERLLVQGDADLIGMTRAFIADPDWIAKAARGEARRIRPCIGVNQDCRAFSPHLHCAVNPSAGRELQPLFRDSGTAARPRRIAVIGGGPGGLETARVSSSRGHAVTLFEASDSVGGQFLYASSVPHRQGLRRFIDYLRDELRQLDVPIELGTRINSAEQLRGLFDVAVLATGAVAMPLDDSLVGKQVISWFEVLEKGAPSPAGNARAVLVDDGSAFWWTYGVGEALLQAGWQLIVATPSAAIASNIPMESVGPLLSRLGRGGTQYRVLSVLTEAQNGGAHLMNVASGEEEIIPCELVVVQTGRRSVAELAPALRQSGLELHMIGDCVTPRRMSHAVFEAQRLALAL